MIKYFLIFCLMCGSAIASNTMQLAGLSQSFDEAKVKKIVPSYKLDSGLYKIEDDGHVLYLYKDGNNVVIHSTKELVTSCK